MKRTLHSSALVVCLLAVLSPSWAQERPDALAMYQQGKYPQAIEICIEEITENPRNLDSYCVLGWSLIADKQYQEAVNWSLKALETSRYDTRVIEILGEGYFYLGKNLEALKWFEEYTNLAPTGLRIHLVYYFMGEVFIRIQEFNHADIALSTALYHSPNIARWWARLGYAREMAKDYRYAQEAYDQALKLNPTLSEALRGKERVAASGAGA